jgi:hypothetical protein
MIAETRHFLARLLASLKHGCPYFNLNLYAIDDECRHKKLLSRYLGRSAFITECVLYDAPLEFWTKMANETLDGPG